MTRSRPFDSVVLIAFGGPLGPADVRPFLANVLRGRHVPPARVEEVASHYDHFGGVSPLTAATRRQASALERSLATRGVSLPVLLGMRNWHPYVEDTFVEMSRAGLRRSIGVIATAHRSFSSCGQYRQNVADAQAAVRRGGLRPPEISYVPDWHDHPGFISANAAQIEVARAGLPPNARAGARLVFTAHSLPERMPAVDRYRAQLEHSARLVADSLGWTDWAVAFQSRSGRPEDPWLGPDVVEYLRGEHARGLRAAVLAPIGFLCDHIEVLYDLDVEAAAACAEMGLPMTRAASVGEHPAFIEALADTVIGLYERHATGRPLPIVSLEPDSPRTTSRPSAEPG